MYFYIKKFKNCGENGPALVQISVKLEIKFKNLGRIMANLRCLHFVKIKCETCQVSMLSKHI